MHRSRPYCVSIKDICVISRSLHLEQFLTEPFLRPVGAWPRDMAGGNFISSQQTWTNKLCDHGACGCALILPVRLQDADGLVVSAETMDSGFNENESEFSVLVLSVALEVLADGNGLTKQSAMQRISLMSFFHTYLLDQHVKVLGDFGCETYVTLSVSWTNSEALPCHAVWQTIYVWGRGAVQLLFFFMKRIEEACAYRWI